jgi:hypothetical protein
LDVITRHRLRQLSVDPAGLEEVVGRPRLACAYQAFLAHTPYENLSNNLALLSAPGQPEAWPRTTDRLLREHAAHGLGGTSFSLAYTLRDLFRGLGANAHCTLGHNLVTEEAHAAVLVYDDEGPWLYDPALLLPGPVPVRPGGELVEPLGRARLEPRCGPTLSLCLETMGEAPRAVYAILPLPAPPPCYRQAWIASFHQGRVAPLRLARRVGDEIRRYGERPGSLEVLRPDGRVSVRAGSRPSALLHRMFGIEERLLDDWFAHQAASA